MIGTIYLQQVDEIIGQMAERLRRMTQAQAYLLQVYSCREICVGSIPALFKYLFALFVLFGTIAPSVPRHPRFSVNLPT
jgi:hypothetical protein